MSSKRYTQEFKVEAVKQVTDRGHSVANVASRLGISVDSLYAWRKHYANPSSTPAAAIDQASELRRVKSELRRVTEERDILEKAETPIFIMNSSLHRTDVELVAHQHTDS